MAGVEWKGNVRLRNGVGSKGRKGVESKGVESGGKQIDLKVYIIRTLSRV